jgi:hypothetical protein
MQQHAALLACPQQQHSQHAWYFCLCHYLGLQVLQSNDTAAPAPKREIILPGQLLQQQQLRRINSSCSGSSRHNSV